MSIEKNFKDISKSHINSFNYFIFPGLKNVIHELETIVINKKSPMETIRVWIATAQLHKPKTNHRSLTNPILTPKNSRELNLTYDGDLEVTICYSINNIKNTFVKKMGRIPIMVKSKACWLYHINKDALITLKEELGHIGGYFICRGIPRLFRLLTSTRKNYPMAIYRKPQTNLDSINIYASCFIRCVRRDLATQTVRIHYLTNGKVNIAITLNQSIYSFSAGILLKCFLESSDESYIEKLLHSYIPPSNKTSSTTNSTHKCKIKRLELISMLNEKAFNHTQSLIYLGKKLRLPLGFGDTFSDIEVGKIFIQKYIFIHLRLLKEKLNLMLIMIQKLYTLITGQCCEDDNRSLMCQELMLPAHFLCNLFHGELKTTLKWIRDRILKSKSLNLREIIEKVPGFGKKFEFLISTGNLLTKLPFDQYPSSSLTIIAEKINYLRYLSHFRSVLHGTRSSDIRDLKMRMLLPESWGFLCPVHSPDGDPCGMLNHLSDLCRVVVFERKRNQHKHEIEKLLCNLGLLNLNHQKYFFKYHVNIIILVEGRLLGVIQISFLKSLSKEIRRQKTSPNKSIIKAKKK